MSVFSGQFGFASTDLSDPLVDPAVHPPAAEVVQENVFNWQITEEADIPTVSHSGVFADSATAPLLRLMLF